MRRARPRLKPRLPIGLSLALCSCLILAGSGWAQMTGFPEDEHLTISLNQSKTQEELISDLMSARRAIEKHPSAENDVVLGRALRRIGQTDAAAKLFDEALEHKPELAEALFEKGLIESAHGNWSKAEDLFRKAIALSPIHAAAHLSLGEMQLRIGNFDGAIREFHLAATLNSQSCGPHQGLGLAFLQQGKAVAAVDEFRQALAACPDYIDAEKSLARALAAEHKWSEAADQLKKVVAVNPNSSEPAFGLATALVNSGDKAASQQEFARAKELAAREIVVLRAKGDTNLGVSFRNAGNLQEAATAFRRAIDDDPKFCDAYDNLGEVLWMQKDQAAALSQFETAVECNPQSAMARNNLGSTLLYFRHDAPGAVEHLRVSANLDPGFALARLNLGKALAAEQEFEASAAELRSAIAIDPDLPAAHLNLGLVLASNRGMSAEAKKELQAALRLDPRLRESIPQQYLAHLQ